MGFKGFWILLANENNSILEYTHAIVLKLQAFHNFYEELYNHYDKHLL